VSAVRIENKHLPAVKAKLMAAQSGACPLCRRNLSSLGSPNQCVDHDHDSGIIRGVLCRTCNGIEGKVRLMAIRAACKEGYIDWLIELGKYLALHKEPQTNYIHPTHLTASEKKVKQLAKARKNYAKKAQAKKVT